MHRVTSTRPIAAILAALCSLPLFANAAENNATPPSSTVEVKVGAYLIDLVKIQGSEQSFEADIAVRYTWQDPRLADPDGVERKLPLDELWHPDITVVNPRGAEEKLPQTATVLPDGTVIQRQRLIGGFSSRFDLRAFPEDKQILYVHFVGRGLDTNQLRIVADPEFTSRADELTVIEWSPGEPRMRDAPYEVPKLGIELPGIKFELPVQRLVGYYIGTVFASAAIIVCMAWLVFWIPAEATNPRISVSVTSMLTLIAHRFVIQNELPHLPYLTHMDFFLLGSTFMVLLGLTGVVVVCKLVTDDRKAAAERLNMIYRTVYPLLFIALLIWML